MDRRGSAYRVGHGDRGDYAVRRTNGGGFVVERRDQIAKAFDVSTYGTGYQAREAAETLRDKMNAPSAEEIFAAQLQNDPGLALEDIAQ